MLYSSFGEKLKEIPLKEILGADFNEKQFWIHFGMTKDEDIFLMGIDGLMFIIDIQSEKIRMKTDMRETFKIQNIDMVKMEGNFITFKNTANNFYLINDIYHHDMIDFGKPSFEMKPGFDASN